MEGKFICGLSSAAGCAGATVHQHRFSFGSRSGGQDGDGRWEALVQVWCRYCRGEEVLGTSSVAPGLGAPPRVPGLGVGRALGDACWFERRHCTLSGERGADARHPGAKLLPIKVSTVPEEVSLSSVPFVVGSERGLVALRLCSPLPAAGELLRHREAHSSPPAGAWPWALPHTWAQSSSGRA